MKFFKTFSAILMTCSAAALIAHADTGSVVPRNTVDTRQALEFWEEVIRLDPNDAGAFNKRGAVCRHL